MRLRLDSGHDLAFIGAAFAGIRALLAMIMVMFAALNCARPANQGTYPADIIDEFRFPGHEPSSHPAQHCALVIEINAARHERDIVLLKTGARTMFTGRSASVAGIDTALIIMMHNIPWINGQAFPETYHETWPRKSDTLLDGAPVNP